MQFMLLVIESLEDFARCTDPAQAPEYWGGWDDFIGSMARAGVIVNGAGLQAPTLRPPCASARASAWCRTVPTPTRRSNWAATSS